MGHRSIHGVVVSACLFGVVACDGGLVAVRTRDRLDHAVAGVTVFGHDASGAIAGVSTTDASGLAVTNVGDGGSITVRRSDSSWYSIFGVESGDDILVHVGGGETPTREVILTAPPLPAGAVRFLASAPCAEAYGADVVTLRIETSCPDRGTVVLTALDADDAAVGYLVLPDADLTASITATGAWQPPSQTFTVTVTGFPSSGGSVAIERGALVDGYPVAWTDISLTTTSTSGSVTGFHSGAGDSVVYRLRRMSGPFCDERTQTFTRSRVADATQLTVDLAEFMAPIGGVTFAPNQMSWTGGGGGVGISASIGASEGSGDVQTGPWRGWGVVAPPGTTSIRFPTDVGFVWPSGIGDRIDQAYVSETDSTYWSSYADVRQNHARAADTIDDDFTTRTSSIALAFGYIGCYPQP
jgi:hypothetical protein